MLPLIMLMNSVSSKEDLLMDIATLPANVLTEASNMAMPIEPIDYIEDIIADMVTVFAMALMHSLKTLLPLKSIKKVLPLEGAYEKSKTLIDKTTPSAIVLAQILLTLVCLERAGTFKDLVGDSANLLANVWTQLLQLLVPLQLMKSNAEKLMEDSGVSGVVNMVIHIVRLEVVDSLSGCLMDSGSIPAVEMVESILPLVQAQLMDTMPDLFMELSSMPGVVMV